MKTIHIIFTFTIAAVILISPVHSASAYDSLASSDNSDESSSAAEDVVAQAAFKRFSNFTSLFGPEVAKKLKFCIKDVDAEWKLAFDFSKNTQFLSACMKQTKGDLQQRLCTAAELEFYAHSVFGSGGSADNYVKPNKNCNLTSWLPGCEPGWACSAGKGKDVDMKNKKEVPLRNLDCLPCCEGFFCPHGLTCMMPCPLGAYCPVAQLNKSTGVCDPYTYQPPSGDEGHKCGAADMWGDVMSTKEIFCSAGYYCQTPTRKTTCTKGHYCRTGSTKQSGCFKLATCDAQTENQNITAYGILVSVGLTLLLLIIYNFSDQVLHLREKNKAKSREAAERSARETAQVREKWKSAKDVAKKGLQSSLSRTFSRQKSNKTTLPPVPKGKKKDNNLTAMVHDPDDSSDGHEGSNVESGDKNTKKPKGKQLHTRSQIFKYAYGQIEKEKALQEQNENLSLSGVISLATDIEFRNRPPIEVSFNDLTLTLKGKNKHLMRCVTGKLSPGRVSAVMGPSGAGKTTFLSALAGKATGCTMTGSIQINGEVETMNSYKRIIGFVPQDDIVHGNLTVEENLWFSARCRLPASLPKAEKVLVVERVILSLGLQNVRGSIVGTVEKRGISGGQRKRVNVGLEMVMEPSLLILDEPTSGLDSSSSSLLLKALRREAAEGVNVSAVVHQPSYTLYKMFDDLILLAKGGLTAYHGPVKKVEEYFAGLGIVLPERVNPPDYFIDILEGIVKPESEKGVDYKELPMRWMLHNGYPVPPDMLGTTGLASPSIDESSANGSNPVAPSEGKSFLGELWQDIKTNVEIRNDHIRHNFLKSSDKSNRITPGVYRQYRYFLGRVGKQQLRDARIQAIDYLLLLIAGICLGTLAKVSDETLGSTGYTYTVIAVSLLGMIAALRSFSLDKLHYWRESASGMSSLAYFLAKDTVDHFSTIVKPGVYLSMFYFFNNPRSTIYDNYFVLVCLVYCVTGIAYALAIYFEAGSAQLWSVLLPVVLTLIAIQEDDEDGFFNKVKKFCYPQWAIEAFIIANASRYSGVWLITRCGALYNSNYELDHWSPCLIKLVCTGVISRIVAYFCLVTFQKK
ncbi:ABC transporter domain-containing protein [Heracleum sosnowskyi]|uniref:ABC transporter domain-containing protein n=1 Tax=Heracleum sosnowskyi TaxID=360622 RepID=A0AAD8GY41_9APIA|nr:ABC transporter domain-containing protein [Heracleum sosnowskyi]